MSMITEQKYTEWNAAGFTHDEADSFVRLGFSIDDAVREYHEWNAAGFSCDEADDFMQEDFTIDEAAYWRQYLSSKHEPNIAKTASLMLEQFGTILTLACKQAGIAPDRAESWLNQMVMEYMSKELH